MENGNVTIGGGNIVSGTIIVASSGKTISVDGSNDKAEVEYSANIINMITQRLARYRMNKESVRIVAIK